MGKARKTGWTLHKMINCEKRGKGKWETKNAHVLSYGKDKIHMIVYDIRSTHNTHHNAHMKHPDRSQKDKRHMHRGERDSFTKKRR